MIKAKPDTAQSAFLPILIIGTLFFIFGFVTWLNGTLIPFLRLSCDLKSDAQALFVTFATYMAYFCLALPSSVILRKTGFKGGIALGLVIMALGCLVFIPAANARSFGLFLTGLFVQGMGLALMQTASNPYIAIVGPPESAASRMGIMGVCNKAAGALSPLILGAIVLKGAGKVEKQIELASGSDRLRLLQELSHRIVAPYAVMTIILLLISWLIWISPLPEIKSEGPPAAAPDGAEKTSIFQFPHLWLGVLCLFLYVGVEVMSGDVIVPYARKMGLGIDQAKSLTSYTMACMVTGYALGSLLVPRVFRQEVVFRFCAILGMILAVAAYLSTGMASIAFICLLGFANSMMWPVFFPLAIAGLGKFTKTGSALMIMGIAGGAIIPQVYARLAHGIGIQGAFLACTLPAYAYIFFYAYKGHRAGLGVLKGALIPVAALAALCVFVRPARAETAPEDDRHPQYEVHPPWINQPNYGNLLRDADVTASGDTGSQHPFYANKGRPAAAWDAWSYAALPGWIDFKMPELRPVSEVRVWMPPGGGPRVYQFFVEGSTYNKDWQLIGDDRHNTAEATLDPVVFTLPHPVMIRYIRVTVTGNSKPEEGSHVWQVEAFSQPVTLALEGAVGSIDRRYDGDSVPLEDGASSWSATAWRGERVSGQFVIWSESDRDELRAAVSPLRGPGGAELPGGAAKTFFVRHVMADGHYAGDVLDTSPRLDMPAGTYRPIWLTVNVPRDAVPGEYTGTLTVRSDDGAERAFPLALDVLPATLPAPANWSFFLDIMQHPWAIANWHGVEPWSEEHFRIMRSYLAILADAGQKVITTTITDRPWNRRDYVDFRSMVEHIREPDGSWRFDYSLFDRYVELCLSLGINRQISCVSILTWGSCYSYTDGATGAERTINAAPGSAAYVDYWRPFLQDFERHLGAKGWLDRTCLCIDEPAPESVRAIADLVRENSPHIHFSIACNEAPSNFHGLDTKDFTVILMQADASLQKDIAARTASGRTTTFYVCMDPLRPNTFINSQPPESVWLGYYTSAIGYSGMERWALTNWPRDPFSETAYSPVLLDDELPAGDNFLLYPGPMSSIRWEMVRAGVVEFEKLRWLREHHNGSLPGDLQKRLDGFRNPTALGPDAAVARQVDEMRAAVNEAARDTVL